MKLEKNIEKALGKLKGKGYDEHDFRFDLSMSSGLSEWIDGEYGGMVPSYFLEIMLVEDSEENIVRKIGNMRVRHLKADHFPSETLVDMIDKADMISSDLLEVAEVLIDEDGFVESSGLGNGIIYIEAFEIEDNFKDIGLEELSIAFMFDMLGTKASMVAYYWAKGDIEFSKSLLKRLNFTPMLPDNPNIWKKDPAYKF